MIDENNNMMPRSGSSALPWVILAVILLVLVIVGVLFRNRLFPSSTNTNTAGTEQSASSGYQAVFLSNGQVYFGKLSGMTASYATLKDIYYLQVTTPPASNDASQLNQQQSQQKQELSLVKLGKELHSPVDEMKINRDQILFYEDMKEEGSVMAAIRKYQKDPNQGAQAPTNNAPQQQAPAANTAPANTAPANR
jgi:hypothetical protein